MEPNYDPNYDPKRSKADILLHHYGVKTCREAGDIRMEEREKVPTRPASSLTKMKLPYEAPSHPGIPTMEEISQAMKDNRLSGRYAQYQVCRIGAVVVKAGEYEAIIHEAENLLFLQQHSQVRVPTVYALFPGPRYAYYMVTEFIEGEVYNHTTWMSLTQDARDKICAKIADQIVLLRSVPHENYYGRVYKQGWRTNLRLLKDRNKELKGPYNTFYDLASAMYMSAELESAISIQSPDWFPIDIECLSEFSSALRQWTSGNEPRLTHLDIGLRNIVIRKIPQEDGTEDWETTLIDWPDLGWYPEWMQTVAINQQMLLHTEDGDDDDAAKDEFIAKVMQKVGTDFSEQKKLMWKMYTKMHYMLL